MFFLFVVFNCTFVLQVAFYLHVFLFCALRPSIGCYKYLFLIVFLYSRCLCVVCVQVVELELLTAQGEVLLCSPEENPEIFRAAQCSIGALGVIVTLTFQCEPQFKLLRKDTSSTLEEVIQVFVFVFQGYEMSDL